MSSQKTTIVHLSGKSQPNLGVSKGLASHEPEDRSLGYLDIALFFGGVLLVALGCRAAVRLRWLPAVALVQPSLPLQLVVSFFLILELYLIVRFRHGPPVWFLLGWKRIRWQSLLIAVAGGSFMAILVDIVAHATTPGTYPIRIPELVLLDIILGPFVEESFFRGCLQPVIARTAGRSVAILATAIMFASLHQVSTVIEWLCLAGTGIAYGWTRTKTNSTSSAACMHAAYNLSLFLFQFR